MNKGQRMNQNFGKGKVALVAGASQGGTGTGTAVRLAAEGARVAICARTPSKLRNTLDQIEKVGGRGVMFECDLGDPSGGRETLVQRTEEQLGPIDYLVYVAAYGPFGKFETITPDSIQMAFEVNVKAPLLLCQQVVTSMRTRRAGGAVVAIGTKAARPIPGPPFPDTPPVMAGAVYGGTKAALHRITQSIAGETYGQGISANVLAPLAAIGTPALRVVDGSQRRYSNRSRQWSSLIIARSVHPLALTGRERLRASSCSVNSGGQCTTSPEPR